MITFPRVLLVAFFMFGIGWANEAHSEIYKYKKSDGSIVYTDNLSQLPLKERAYYNELKEARKQKEQEEERRLGTDEYQRKLAERKRAELLRRKMSQEERKQRLAAIDRQLKVFQEKRDKDHATKTQPRGCLQYLLRWRWVQESNQQRQWEAAHDLVGLDRTSAVDL